MHPIPCPLLLRDYQIEMLILPIINNLLISFFFIYYLPIMLIPINVYALYPIAVCISEQLNIILVRNGKIIHHQ